MDKNDIRKMTKDDTTSEDIMTKLKRLTIQAVSIDKIVEQGLSLDEITDLTGETEYAVLKHLGLRK